MAKVGPFSIVNLLDVRIALTEIVRSFRDLTGENFRAFYNGYSEAGLVPSAALGSGNASGANFLRGDQVWAAGSVANPVTATVDFGAEADFAQTVITGQTWVEAASTILVGHGGASADHDLEDALLEEIELSVSDLVPGVGFTINAYAPNSSFGVFNVNACGA